eukprot:TRINITY_DN7006_c1_g1_i2.p1 TRINITY_DN7006_c1_g1~~TRINITY_DN7006_c1_g1_i2.p1  ORF type:complete len:364 (-),score=83.54 TRINITY_DN7006_c1_g1_i2:204-1181(-)
MSDQPFNYQDYDDDSQIPRDDAGAVNMEWQWNQALSAALSSVGIEGQVSAAVNESDSVEHAMLVSRLQEEEHTRKEDQFEEQILSARGLVVKTMPDDGNCLFAAVADQVYGDWRWHLLVRKLCLDLMTSDRDHYSQFVAEDFNDYIARKRCPRVYGNNLEIQALGEVYGRPIEVFEYDVVPMNTFQGEHAGTPIRISYHRGNHYNSLVDPSSPVPPSAPEDPDTALYDQREGEATAGRGAAAAAAAAADDVARGVHDGMGGASSRAEGEGRGGRSPPAPTPTPMPEAAEEAADAFACSACSASFAAMDDLQVHMLTECPMAAQFQ